jgi:hypothetical protein
MPEEPTPERFKAQMPDIPGVSSSSARSRPGNTALRLVGGLLFGLLMIFALSRFLGRNRHAEPAAVEAPPQIQVPSPPPDPNAGIPTVTEGDPVIASVSEMAKPWNSKEFFYKNALSGENVAALLIRLPGGSPNQSSGYWGLVMTAAYGNCKLEYIMDMQKLRNDYDYRGAKHPMVGDPCSRTLFDPTKLMNLPGNVWARGQIVQGSDLRPPLAIQVDVKGKDVVALRME